MVASCLGPAGGFEAASEAYSRIAAALKETGTRIVHERMFASLGAQSAVLSARQRCFEQAGIEPAGPVTCIEGRPFWGEGLAGVVIRAVGPVEPGDEVRTIADRGVPVGRGWRRRGAEFLVLQNIQGLSADPGDQEAPALQAGRAIARAEHLLRQNGIAYRDVIRTWFYLADILEWYDAFNRERSARYADYGLLLATGDGGLLPASTGVGGRADGGAAVVLDLLAAAGPKRQHVHTHRLTNPGQREAIHYGSAFARGVLVREPDAAVIQISGTAAIDQAGRSIRPGDVRAQIQCTFDKIDGLLAQAGAGLADICAATVFMKRPEFAAEFQALAAARGLTDFPGVCVVGDICRPDLLFEIDAEAAVDLARVPSSMINL
jgi:enamine deaminase RidA (YjgF/YER057c/UK114 family)